MSGDQDTEIQHALDFTTTFADGVVLQYSAQVCRLMFYDEVVDVEDVNGRSKLNPKKTIRMKSEVRIHRVPLIGLADAIKKAQSIQDKTADEAKDFLDDKEVQDAFRKALQGLEYLLLDSGARSLTVSSISQLQDDLDSLSTLISRADARRKREQKKV